MGQRKRDIAQSCGRLYAALWALERIGAGTDELGRPGRARYVITNGPEDKLRRLLDKVGGQLYEATARQPEARAAAALELVRGIAEFIPAGGIPSGNFNPEECEAFERGFAEQRAMYEEKWKDLLPGKTA
ncbi:hypothetical protein AB0K92_09990 [Streptomyces sp. NPDC052687]|uniref:hypothetical protein n=1 Tax=Streptomyces sp. NPDC052687 TaxID=3154759 RepID=UPI003417614B